MNESVQRCGFFVCGVIAIVLGLGSRRYGAYLPEFLALNAGDTFWTMLVFCGFSFILPNRTLLTRAALTLGFAYAIEISQLYQAAWINTIRNTTLGGLVLGFQFVWVDLARYAVGVALCIAMSHVISQVFSHRAFGLGVHRFVTWVSRKNARS